MALDLSCAFATSMESHEHARIAEDLGYKRAWFYDSPALYPDVWVQLCRAAERTQRIGLGPGVLVPSLRHPMVECGGDRDLGFDRRTWPRSSRDRRGLHRPVDDGPAADEVVRRGAIRARPARAAAR